MARSRRGRARTRRGAAATLSPWSLAILTAYVKKLGIDLAPNAPIFRNRSGAPYSKDTLGDDFRDARETFDKGERRHLADMRRSGAIEGEVGGGSVTDQAQKMANSIDTNKRLRRTYNPVNVESVRRFHQARAAGAKLLEQKPDKSIREPALLILFQKGAKSVTAQPPEITEVIGARDGARTRDLRRDRPGVSASLAKQVSTFLRT